MKLQILSETFSMCRSDALPPSLRLIRPLFLCLTDEEVSILCPSDHVPQDIECRSDGWKGLRIAGTLDFSLVGVLRSLLSCLADGGIPVCAVSSFNTDYLFIQCAHFGRALQLLRQAGHTAEPID